MSEKVVGIEVQIGGDTVGLNKALQSTNKEISSTQKELSQVERLLKLDPKNTELLAQKQQLLSKAVNETSTKLDALKSAKQKADDTMKKGGEVNQEQYRKLQREIVSTEQSIDKLKNSTDASGKEFDKLSQKSDKLKGTLGGVGKVAGTVAGAIVGLGAAGATALISAEESTREYRSDLSKLEVNAKQTGMSFDTMKGHLKSLVTLTDETDSSIEALSNLMQTGFSENNMEELLGGLSGAIISFPDTLKIESLADGLQETLATGKATGQFGELLERCGMNLDTFNEGLSNASKAGKEQEFILETLSKTGMSEVNQAYIEANKNLITMKEAQFQLNDAMASMGEIAEPVIASVMSLVAEMVTELVNAYKEGGLTGLATAFGDTLSNLLTKVAEKLPSFINIGVQIISSLIQGMQNNSGAIMNSAVVAISSLIQGILPMLPELLQLGITLIAELANGIATQLPTLIPLAIECLLNLVTTFLDNIDLIINAGISLLIGLANGLVEALPILIEKAPEIINSLVMAIANNLPLLVEVAITLIITLAQGIIGAIPELIKAIPEIITSLVNGFKTYYSNMADVGKNIVEGIWNGIKNAKDWLFGKIKNFADSVVEDIKDAFGIESPSKVMRDQVGKYMAQGIGVGFTKEIPHIISSMKDKMDSITSIFSTGELAFAGVPVSGSNFVNQNSYITKNYSNTTEVVRQPSTVVLEINERELGRVVVPAYNRENNRIGVVMK